MAQRKGSVALRKQLVANLEGRNIIKTDAVRQAFLGVPRELFVPEVVDQQGLEAIYADQVFVTKTDSKGQAISSSSQPGIMAPMLENLALSPGMRVLEIGAGTGYNAALMKHIVGDAGRVTAIDIDADTAKRARAATKASGLDVRILHGDGRDGAARGAPYDRIVATASNADVPFAWFEQLRDGGLLELPLRLRRDTFGPQLVVTFEKRGDGLVSVRQVPGGFMTIRAADGADAIDWDRIVVRMTIRGRDLTIAIVGQALRRLDEASRARLIATMAGRPRTTIAARGTRSQIGGAALYVALNAPAGRRFDGLGWWGSVVCGADLASAASVIPHTTDERSRLEVSSFGDGTAAAEVIANVDAWKSLGRPTLDDLRTTVRYPGGRCTIRFAWR